jgi:hypothetical protein
MLQEQEEDVPQQQHHHPKMNHRDAKSFESGFVITQMRGEKIDEQ